MKSVNKTNSFWNEEDEQTIEFTEKMETSGISQKFDIVLDIVKVNTDEEIGA